KLVVVDDASKEPVAEADYRFEENAGIARAKNKCLELLDGCEHIFLFDDDCYPKVPGWEKPYIQSPEPHLAYHYLVSEGRSRGVVARYSGDDKHEAYAQPQGCMMYAHRSVLDAVGGLDPVFGLYGHEHGDWSNRIHSAGLTTWRYADVKGSGDLLVSLDQLGQVKSSVSSQLVQETHAANKELKDARKDTPLYVEYREQRDYVVTPLLTTQPDHQRGGKRWNAYPMLLKTLADSLARHNLVVLRDEDIPGLTVDSYKIRNNKLEAYFQRWVSLYHWLRDHPEARYVWAVDGFDVEMLNNPFPHMKPGLLYVGHEPKITGIEWMYKVHPNRWLHEFLKDHSSETLLNAGVCGGDRATMLTFAHLMTRYIMDVESGRSHNKNIEGLGQGDMALFNYVARKHFSDRLVYGPQVATVFKAEERTD